MRTKTPARFGRRLLVAAMLGLGAEITMSQSPAQPNSQPAVQPAVQHAAPSVRPFGRLPDGREAMLYTLEAGGWRATVTDFGAILTSFRFPPAAGAAAGSGVDVALGFDDLAGYVAKHPYFGATCGRIAGRIKGAAFELDGKHYPLAKNLADTHLHGGVEGFDKKLWKGTPRATDRGPAVEFELVSPDGEEGYPGRLTARVVYTLTPAGELWVEMTATTAAPTIVNLAHHLRRPLPAARRGQRADGRVPAGGRHGLRLPARAAAAGPLRPGDRRPAAGPGRRRAARRGPLLRRPRLAARRQAP
jgi:aldose 1-epimerase